MRPNNPPTHLMAGVTVRLKKDPVMTLGWTRATFAWVPEVLQGCLNILDQALIEAA